MTSLRALLLGLGLAIVTALPAAVAADEPSTESAERLSEPPRGFRPVRGERPGPEAPPWDGPRVEIGWMHYGLTDGVGGGATNTFTFGGWVPTGPLRLGGLGELGARQYELGSNDAIARGQVMVGYQVLTIARGRVVPYAVAVGTLGVVVGKRFRTSFAHSIYGLGLEAGADLNLVRRLWIGAAIGYQRVTSDGLAYDLFTFRLSLGL